ncbi:MAG: hypothetical protein ACKOFH_09360, partial [Chthoniobacterales bacterium]
MEKSACKLLLARYFDLNHYEINPLPDPRCIKSPCVVRFVAECRRAKAPNFARHRRAAAAAAAGPGNFSSLISAPTILSTQPHNLIPFTSII